jgi:hypothetical protein
VSSSNPTFIAPVKNRSGDKDTSTTAVVRSESDDDDLASLGLPGWIDDPLRTHGVVTAAFEAAIAALDPIALNRSSHAQPA